MSESWQPEESSFWQTRPAESSHPSFPFVERAVDPYQQSLAPSQPIPPPPPPPLGIAHQDDRTTAPIIGTTFGMGIGVIVGVVITCGVLVAVLGYLLLNGGLVLGNHAHANEANTASLSSGGNSTQGATGGGTAGTSHGDGGSVPGVTSTNGATAAPGTTPSSDGTPGDDVTATTIAATGTGTPPTATSTPAPLPLTVQATAQSHKAITITVQTKAGAALAIKVSFCDGTSTTLTGTASAGVYTTVITNGIPKCSGNSPDLVTVTGQLAGYSDATVTTSTTQVGG